MGCFNSKADIVSAVNPPPSVQRRNSNTTSSPSMYRALFDFDTANEDDVAFKKGDRLEVDPTTQGFSSEFSAIMGCFNSKADIVSAVNPPPSVQRRNSNTTSSPSMYRALFDFDTANEDDVAFKKGDRLEVDPTTQTGEWWIATHATSGKKGYIPSNYVCMDDNKPQNQDCWFDCGKKEAGKMLLSEGNQPGTFLIRGTSDKTSVLLSVRETIGETGDPCIKNYRIRNMDDGGVYISPKRTFPTLIELVEHYKKNADGLCCILTDACPRERPVMVFDELEVTREVIKLADRLGAGCFGEVWKGKLYQRVDVAVKTLKQGSMSPEAFLTEAKLMHKLQHKKLVQLMAVHTATEPIWIVTELCVNGALLDYLRGDKDRKITFPTMVTMASQIAEGMAFLERENFVHGDLRAANILVGEHHAVKVADFGLARVLERDDICEAREGARFPIKWMAPEAALEHKFSIKSDVWSFGVLLYEIVTKGRTPYPGMTGSDVIQQIIGPKFYRMPKPTQTMVECPDVFYEFMLLCWKHKPEERPTFDYLHPFFDDYWLQQ